MAQPADEPVLSYEALHRPAEAPVLTVQQHIQREQSRIPGAAANSPG